MSVLDQRPNPQTVFDEYKQKYDTARFGKPVDLASTQTFTLAVDKSFIRQGKLDSALKSGSTADWSTLSREEAQLAIMNGVEQYRRTSLNNNKWSQGKNMAIYAAGEYRVLEDTEYFSRGQIIKLRSDKVPDGDNEVRAYDHEGGDYYINVDYIEPVVKGENTVNNDPVTAITEIELTADDRLLRKYGLENSVGVPSTRGRDALVNSLWAEKRTEIAGKLRKAIAAEKADVEKETTDQ